MDSLISRQAAIDACIRVREYRAYDEIEEIKALPSAQSEPLDEWCTDCKEYDHEKHCCPRWNRVIRQTLKDMKEEQPEIILCKDCKFNPKYEWFGCPMSHLSEKQRPETAWCWKAKRRTDEQDSE